MTGVAGDPWGQVVTGADVDVEIARERRTTRLVAALAVVGVPVLVGLRGGAWPLIGLAVLALLTATGWWLVRRSAGRSTRTVPSRATRDQARAAVALRRCADPGPAHREEVAGHARRRRRWLPVAAVPVVLGLLSALARADGPGWLEALLVTGWLLLAGAGVQEWWRSGRWLARYEDVRSWS